MVRHWLLAIFVTLVAAPVVAEMPPIMPAFRADELRAIGHVATVLPAPGAGGNLGGCTGTLIAPTIVLTAAHCAASRVDNPQDLYITFGWASGGPPLWRGSASRVLLYPEYRADRFDIDTLHLDLAVVVLPRPVPEALVTPIPLVPGHRAESYGSYGYLAHANTLLRGHESCQTVDLRDAGIWGFDCDVVGGFSGGPLLAETPDGPVVAAVAVANVPGVSEGIRSFAAIPVPRLFPDGQFPAN